MTLLMGAGGLRVTWWRFSHFKQCLQNKGVVFGERQGALQVGSREADWKRRKRQGLMIKAPKLSVQGGFSNGRFCSAERVQPPRPPELLWERCALRKSS